MQLTYFLQNTLYKYFYDMTYLLFKQLIVHRYKSTDTRPLFLDATKKVDEPYDHMVDTMSSIKSDSSSDDVLFFRIPYYYRAF